MKGSRRSGPEINRGVIALESKYNRVTPDIVERLKKIVGPKNVIYGDEEKLEPYSHDEVSEKEYSSMPEVVIKPTSADEISEIMKLANKHRIPVTPRGAGSGLSGGAVPIFRGIVLSFEKMNKILEIDTKNLVAVVEPGVITNEINEKLKDYGLFFPGYPMSVESCYIGGNVAENAGGGRAVKYGVTGRYILGIEVVTPEGDIITLGGKRMKDVVGYDLVKLMVGSEGTLGIFTKIIIKLLPLPTARVALLVLFEDVETALRTVPKIMTNGHIIPTAIEFMSKLAVHNACKYLNEHLPYEKAGAMLLIELDGNNKESLERDYETIGELCFENKAIEVYVADNHTTLQRVWKVRQNIPESFIVISSNQTSEDIVVPISEIPTFVKKMEILSEKYKVLIPCYGHAGDGNIHVRVVKKPEMSLDKWYSILPAIRREIFQIAVDLGGTISGEHGIGHKRKQYINLVLDKKTIEIMKKIKLAFDPNNILNPGKIFDI